MMLPRKTTRAWAANEDESWWRDDANAEGFEGIEICIKEPLYPLRDLHP